MHFSQEMTDDKGDDTWIGIWRVRMEWLSMVVLLRYCLVSVFVSCLQIHVRHEEDGKDA